MSTYGRFGRGKSRLIEREHANREKKAAYKRIGKIAPEDTVKIPLIGEWQVGDADYKDPREVKRAMTAMKKVRPFPRTVPLTQDQVVRVLEAPEDVPLPPPPKETNKTIQAPFRLQTPKVLHPRPKKEPKLEFPEGTATTDLSSILRSKRKSPTKPLPPLNEIEDDGSEFLPLEYFDDIAMAEFTVDELMQNPRAVSKYTANGQTNWEHCKVLQYDEESRLFWIKWDATGALKRVPRFNLRFDVESKEKFEKRVAAAEKARVLYQAELRFDERIAIMPLDESRGLRPGTFRRIQERTGKHEGKYAEMQREMEESIKKEFKVMQNKMEFIYELEHNPLIPNREEFMLLLQREREIVPELGLVDIGDYDYVGLRNAVVEKHLLGKPFIQEGAYKIWGVFYDLHEMMFLQPGFPGTVTLQDFVTKQYQHFGGATKDFKTLVYSSLQTEIAKVYLNKRVESLPGSRKILKKMVTLFLRMMHTLLRNIVINTTSKYLEIFEKYLDSECKVEPQFYIDVYFHEKKKLQLMPGTDVFEEQLITILHQLETTVAELPKVPPEILKFDVSVSFDDCVKIVHDQREKCAEILSRLSGFVRAFIEENQYVVQLLEMNPKTYVHEFDPDGKRSLADYRDQVYDFKEKRDRIKNEFKSSYSLGLFRLSCSSFRNAALEHADDFVRILLDQVKQYMMNTIAELNQEYNGILDALKQVPTTPEELAKVKQYVDSVKSADATRKEKIREANSRFSFLEEFQYDLEDADFEERARMLEMPTKSASLIEEAERMINQEKIKMIRELRASQRKLEEDTLSISEEISGIPAKFTELEMAFDAFTYVSQIGEKLQEMKTLQELYNSHERLFDFEPSGTGLLTKLNEQFAPFQALWSLASEWYEVHTQWLSKPFPQVKADSMNQFLILSYKKCLRLKKELSIHKTLVNRVLLPLEKEIEEFRQHMPLLMKLRHPGIKTKHWEMISKIVGFTVMPSLDMPLHEFLELKLGRWMGKISEIAGVAAQEYAVESSLDQMDADLRAIEFVTIQYKDSGHFILQQIDDIIAVLDDQTVTTQTLLTSPFIAPVKDRAVERLQFLKTSHQILDKWVGCQRNWLYLQPIFSGTTIEQKLQKEASDWACANKLWSTVMTITHNHPEFLNVMGRDGLGDQLRKCDRYLEEIVKGLNAYLETKRLAFPRFFFLSNDELIFILSHTRDFDKIQDSMSKLFEYVHSITVDNQTITHMNDLIGETVELLSSVNGDTPEIEDWLLAFEEEMKVTLKQAIKKSLATFASQKRDVWIRDYPAQVALITNQIMWTQFITNAFKTQRLKGLQALEVKYSEQLDYLCTLVRNPLDSLTRQTISCLLISEVHNRDIIRSMIEDKVSDEMDFDWVKQLRYYWEDDTVMVRSINNTYEYSYEYAGNSPRLVMTPLTDRCYQTLLAAFKQNLSGAPSGPAGTGKTETVRDCAKALGRSCVVYNCSENVTPEQMSQFFAGQVSAGSWSCFDEFNRINIEVLSVIAQQVRTIQSALNARADIVILDHRTLKLNSNAAICITMNPGYAGRTELPDNLKALFRPCAMMVPDYKFICEILLFSGGFATASTLAVKLVALFSLCATQLSNCHHYDWGLRAMKALLGNAAMQRQTNPDLDEAVNLIHAVRNCTASKLLSIDLPLFYSIIEDVFPGVKAEKVNDDKLVENIKRALREMNEQPLPTTIDKAVEVYDTQQIRHGVMLVGCTMSGKSTAWKALNLALNYESEGKALEIRTLNPKSVSLSELYGNFNPATSEWADGILSSIIRQCSFAEDDAMKWIIVDGPVDSLWIESMNSLLDDNKVLCLPNNERIQLTRKVRMMFEVGDLDQASPATVSRCGMIYFDKTLVTWEALVDSWKNRVSETHPEVATLIAGYLEKYIPGMIRFIEKDGKMAIRINSTFAVKNLLKLLDCYVLIARKNETVAATAEEESKTVDPLIQSNYFSQFSPSSRHTIPILEEQQFSSIFERVVIFCLIWSFGGLLEDESRPMFDKFFKDHCERNEARCPFPPRLTVFDYYPDLSNSSWVVWCDGETGMEFTGNNTIERQMIPTNTSAALLFLSRLMSHQHENVLAFGPESCKTLTYFVLTQNVLDKTKFACHHLPLSSCTEPCDLRKFMMSHMHRRHGKYGPLLGQHLLFVIDNLSSVKPEEYGGQPTLELLRQFCDYSGWYNPKTIEFTEIAETSLLSAMGQPGGGCYAIPDRLLRHFFTIHVPKYNTGTIQEIMNQLLMQRMGRYGQCVRENIKAICSGTCAMLEQMNEKLLPVPSKLHYVFGIRNIVRIVEGLMLPAPASIEDKSSLLRLWYHEMMREFYDRLNTQSDRKWFADTLSQAFPKHFNCEWNSLCPTGFVMFNQFTDGSQSYKEVEVKPEQVLRTCNSALEDHNNNSSRSIDITLFHEAVDHLSAISRVLTMERGHILLVGEKSSGRRSLARLALHTVGYELFEIAISSAYDLTAWHEDLKNLFKQCGINDQVMGFVINDRQIVLRQQLEDLENLIADGMITQIYEQDEIEQIKLDIAASELQASGADYWQLFMDRIRKNLHVIFTLSPYGNVFRDLCLNFTSLRGECTIDWFMPWSQDALESVAHASLLRSEEQIDKAESVVSVCVKIHKNVESEAQRYFRETKRFTAVTPSRYFELLATFQDRLAKKQRETSDLIRDYETGVEKIKSTRGQIEGMRRQLDQEVPVLEQTRNEVEEMLKELTIKQKEAEQSRVMVEQQSKVAEKEAAAAHEANAIAQEQFALAQPYLEEAQAAVQKLDKDSLVNIKKLHQPSAGMKDTFDAVCIMFGRQPRKVEGSKQLDYWPEAVLLLNDVQFIKNVTNFKMENIPKETIQKLKKYVPAGKGARNEKRKAALASFAAVGALYDWVCASYDYWFVYQDILPKKMASEEAAKRLAESEAQLEEARAHLAEIEATLKNLMEKVEEMQGKEKVLAVSVETTQVKLSRAQKIISGLSGETTRWSECAENLRVSSAFILGDSLLIAGALTYLGAFSSGFREKMLEKWKSFLETEGISFSSNFSIESSLGNDVTTRDWIIKGLPNDQHSIENALIITRSEKSIPLLIDPQLSGTKWVRAIYGKDLVVLNFDQEDFVLQLKMAISTGKMVLIDNAGLKLDPVIDPILSKEVMRMDGKLMISISGDMIAYNENFRLFISTKYPNPHYSPEICSETTLINFTTTHEGLVDLLLNNLIEVEREDLDRKRIQMMESNAENSKRLKELEQEILQIVANTGSDILEDDKAIDTLQSAQKTSAMIAQQMAISKTTEEQIQEFKTKFKSVVTRAALLYFCASDFGVIDPMYQFSLKWFVPLFRSAIQGAQHPQDHKEIVNSFNKSVSITFYQNVSHSLFSRHKLLFSTLMAFRILSADKEISPHELAFLVSPEPMKTPSEVLWMQPEHWTYLGALPKVAPVFSKVIDHMKKNQASWQKWIDSDKSETEDLPSSSAVTLTPFQKLLLIRIFHLDRMREALRGFIEATLGKEFTVPPTLNLLNVFKNGDPLSPLVFIIMPGIDPEDEILTVATSMGVDKYLKPYSLGRGQGQGAEDLILDAADRGFWVLLQNCHLSLSWMPRLEQIINNLSPDKVHSRFRLCLVTMSSDEFPIGILYQATKLIYEIPKGMRENVMRIYNQFDPDDYQRIDPMSSERMVTFKLAVFHSVILERLQFGSLGWNIPYEFNPSDFLISKRHMKAFLDEATTSDIPYTALSYVIGELDYGGRVTDSWDRRALVSILKLFFADDTREFLNSRYEIPSFTAPLQRVIDTVSKWPLITEGSDIGLSANASTITSRNEALKIFTNLIEVQPTIVAPVDIGSEEQFELSFVTNLLEQIPSNFNLFDFHKRFDVSVSLNAVLNHEVQLYNKLLTVIKDSLQELINGLKGLVIIDDRLDMFKRRLLGNRVPELWLRHSFPSILPLRAYVNDLRTRVQFLDGWVRGTIPMVFSLGAFFHPEEFLTSVLQTYARKHHVPVDSLRWTTTPLGDQVIDRRPDEGVYIAGLAMEGAKWDLRRKCLVECGTKDLVNYLPVMHLVPTDKTDNYDMTVTYECPVYRTQNRGTGALDLPNYILSFFLSTPSESPDTWVQRSVAAFLTTEAN